MKHHTTSCDRSTHYIHDELVFAYNICNKGLENVETITRHVWENYEEGLIHVLNSDKEAIAEKNYYLKLKCLRVPFQGSEYVSNLSEYPTQDIEGP